MTEVSIELVLHAVNDNHSKPSTGIKRNQITYYNIPELIQIEN